MAFAWGVRAVNDDSKLPADDVTRPVFDFNAAVLTRILCIACVVGGFSSVAFLGALQRFARQLVLWSIYASIFVQLLMTCSMFAVSAFFGVLMMIPLAVTCFWFWFARHRIPFAAAHVEVCVEAVRAYPHLYIFAMAMLFAQFVWTMMWQLAAFGIENSANNQGGSGAKAVGTTTGGVLFFGMLVSLVWGCQLLSYVTQFVVASTVGSWWFVSQPVSPVKESARRAFTTSLGSLSVGALVVSVIEAARLSAKRMQMLAERDRNGRLAFLAAAAACIIGCVERLVEFFNHWAVIMCALTGADFRTAGAETMALFGSRGWTLVVNEDLVAPALRIACLVPAAASAIAGGALCYGATPSLSVADRGNLAGIAAFLSFLIGFAMATIMTSVLTAGVRTIFVCFALNPQALATTHPESLAKLSAAWQEMYPQVWLDSGYASHFGSTGQQTSASYPVPPV